MSRKDTFADTSIVFGDEIEEPLIISSGTTDKPIRKPSATTSRVGEPKNDESSKPSEVQAGRFLDVSLELSEFISAKVLEVMDITIGRYQVVQRDPSLVAELLSISKRDIESILRFVAKKGQQAVLNNDSDLHGMVRLLSTDLSKAKEVENELNRKLAESVEEHRRAMTHINVLQGQLVRRDKMLTEQRTEFIKELSYLKEAIRQMKTRGRSDVHDMTFYSWNEDPLAEEILRDEKVRLENIIEDMKGKFDRDREWIESIRQKEIDELRRQLESQKSLKEGLRHVVVQTDISAVDIAEYEPMLTGRSMFSSDGASSDYTSASSSYSSGSEDDWKLPSPLGRSVQRPSHGSFGLDNLAGKRGSTGQPKPLSPHSRPFGNDGPPTHRTGSTSIVSSSDRTKSTISMSPLGSGKPEDLVKYTPRGSEASPRDPDKKAEDDKKQKDKKDKKDKKKGKGKKGKTKGSKKLVGSKDKTKHKDKEEKDKDKDKDGKKAGKKGSKSKDGKGGKDSIEKGSKSKTKDSRDKKGSKKEEEKKGKEKTKTKDKGSKEKTAHQQGSKGKPSDESSSDESSDESSEVDVDDVDNKGATDQKLSDKASVSEVATQTPDDSKDTTTGTSSSGTASSVPDDDNNKAVYEAELRTLRTELQLKEALTQQLVNDLNTMCEQLHKEKEKQRQQQQEETEKSDAKNAQAEADDEAAQLEVFERLKQYQQLRSEENAAAPFSVDYGSLKFELEGIKDEMDDLKTKLSRKEDLIMRLKRDIDAGQTAIGDVASLSVTETTPTATPRSDDTLSSSAGGAGGKGAADGASSESGGAGGGGGGPVPPSGGGGGSSTSSHHRVSHQQAFSPRITSIIAHPANAFKINEQNQLRFKTKAAHTQGAQTSSAVGIHQEQLSSPGSSIHMKSEGEQASIQQPPSALDLAKDDLIKKLRTELEYKDSVLTDKKEEIDKLTNDLESWFEAYGKKNSPFSKHFEIIEHIKIAFEAAEQGEEAYRVMSWAVMSHAVVAHSQQKGLKEDVEALVRASSLQRGGDLLATMEAFHDEKLQRMLTERRRLKELSNRNWDKVLFHARKLVKPRGKMKYINLVYEAMGNNVPDYGEFIRPGFDFNPRGGHKQHNTPLMPLGMNQPPMVRPGSSASIPPGSIPTSPLPNRSTSATPPLPKPGSGYYQGGAVSRGGTPSLPPASHSQLPSRATSAGSMFGSTPGPSPSPSLPASRSVSPHSLHRPHTAAPHSSSSMPLLSRIASPPASELARAQYAMSVPYEMQQRMSDGDSMAMAAMDSRMAQRPGTAIGFATTGQMQMHTLAITDKGGDSAALGTSVRATTVQGNAQRLKGKWLSKAEFSSAPRETKREEVLKMLYWDRKRALENQLLEEIANTPTPAAPMGLHVGRLIGKNQTVTGT